MTSTIVILLVIYQLKHWFADYPLQTPWMLGKFKEKGWALPLAAHAMVHAMMTLMIVCGLAVFRPVPVVALALPFFDFIVHFTMDRIKASPSLMGRWKNMNAQEFELMAKIDADPTDKFRAGREERWQRFKKHKLLGNKLFWWALGFDQMVHHLTHYACIYVMTR